MNKKVFFGRRQCLAKALPGLRIGLIALLVTTVPTPADADEAAESPEDAAAKLEFFETRIRPVLADHCYACHSSESESAEGGLLLDSREGLRAGGESGVTIVPGDPTRGLLLPALKHESLEMPPDQRLPKHVLDDFTRWIADGAVDPRAGGKVLQREAIDLEAGRQFWSYQPLRKPAVPRVAADSQTDGFSDWCRTEIDQFLLARMVSENLSPAADATAERMCRRLYFDLWGLPPTPEQQRAFAERWAIDQDRAVSWTADELLQSRHFAERWGRHWLDITRFAESSGGGRSLMYPDAWRFRDYVIQSLHEDHSLSRMIQEHIAGDLLPSHSDSERDRNVIASGFLTLGPTNYEQQDKQQLRMDVIDEQIDTIGRAFLGQTLGCARCHDHKFDPIPMTDYYGLVGIFRSTETLTPGNVSGYVKTALQSPADSDAMAAWKAKDVSLSTKLADARRELQELGGPILKESVGEVFDTNAARLDGNWIESTSIGGYVGSHYLHCDDPRTGRSVQWVIPVKVSGNYQLRMTWTGSDNRSSGVPIGIKVGQQTLHAAVNQTGSPNTNARPKGDAALIRSNVFPAARNWQPLFCFTAMAGDQLTVTIDAERATPGYVIADAVALVRSANSEETPAGTQLTSEQQHNLLRRSELQQTIAGLEEQQKAHARGRPAEATAMSVRDADQPADWHLHLRGGVRQLGPVVPRTYLSVATTAELHPGLAPALPIPLRQSGRLQLAEWITAESNPLTARVMANRLWQKLLGRGIVATPDNFGSTGARPTHPELLDYLGHRLIHHHRWSLKSAVREIVLSRAYRMGPAADADVLSKDPVNEHWTRRPSRRLDAEALRDAMLLVSGQLDLSVRAGKTIQKVSQYDVGYDHTSYGLKVRSVFLPAFRNARVVGLEVFDQPNPNLVAGRRVTSTLPAQALYLLNSDFASQQALAAAERILNDIGAADQSGQVSSRDLAEACWRWCLSRAPDSEELELVSYVWDSADSEEERRQAAMQLIQALFCSAEFRFAD